MKKILLALFVMCSALSFSAKVIKSDRIETKGNVVYEIGQKTPYTGVLENYNEKGVVDARAEFKNGVMDGYSKLYYPSGKLLSEVNFKNDKEEGLMKAYYENGKLQGEATYKNGQLDGVAKLYDENGKVVEEATFKNGKQVK